MNVGHKRYEMALENSSNEGGCQFLTMVIMKSTYGLLGCDVI
jgi:hypothetical protein